ncbi:hypothetical protein A0U40_03705 [[Bacillus] sp. KCTC 13219]|nr:hypothetical protein A0U40_03705 [[Bacillus] sp. KCTC 13219]
MKNEQQKKKQKTLYLRQDTIEKITLLVEEENFNSDGEVIDFLVESYFESRFGGKPLLAEIEGLLQQRLLETVIDDLKHLRATVNTIDCNTKMMMEFWNHYFLMSGANTLDSTEKIVSTPFEEAKQLVRERNAHNRQKKLEKEMEGTPTNSQLSKCDESYI